VDLGMPPYSKFWPSPYLP